MLFWMCMKTLDGKHLTQTEKKAMNAMLDANILHAKVGRKIYMITKLDDNTFEAVIHEAQSDDYGNKSLRTYKARFQK